MRTLTRGRFRLLVDYRGIPSPVQPHVAEGPSALRCSDHAAEHYVLARRDGAIPQDREAFVVLMLNARHRIMALHVAHVGTLNSCPVGMREIFRPAIAAGAHAIIVAHHHPSGDHTPSPEDRRVTERINKAGELLGISCLDHLVIGGTRFFSFADGITRDLPRVQRPQDRP